MLIGLSSSAAGASSTPSGASASVAGGAVEISSAGAVSFEGVISKGAGAADCRRSFASASIRRIITAMANVSTAAQAATAPASAYKTPMPVGSRSTL